MSSRASVSSLAWLAFTALVVACDGGRPSSTAITGVTAGALGAAPPHATAHLRTPPHGVPALLAANGALRPPLPEAVPRERNLRTRAGLYATREQAEDLAGDLGGEVIWLELDCDGVGALERAQDTVATASDARALEREAPVLLSAAAEACRASAAWLADRLDDLGYSRVFLVTA